jgi:hypothetical protein
VSGVVYTIGNTDVPKDGLRYVLRE